MSKKKTHEQFIKEVFELVGNEYTVLSNYNGNKIKVLMQHNSCGHKWEIKPNCFFSAGHRCPICAYKKISKAKRKSNEQFVEEIYNLVYNEYSVLENYKGSMTKIRFRHNKCGHEFNMLPGNFIHLNQRCPKCAGNEKKTQEQFVQDVFELVGSEYTVLSEYKTTEHKVLIRHNKCGHEWLITPHSFLRGHGCPKCAKKKLSSIFSKTQECFEQNVRDLVGDKYTVMSKYKNGITKITMKHNECGYIWDTTPSSFLTAHECPKCSKERVSLLQRKTNARFVKEVKLLVGNEYAVLSDYKGSKAKVHFKHEKCGYEFDMSPNGFLTQDQRCPKCAGNMKKNTLQFKKEVFGLTGNEYIVLGEYVNSKLKIRLKHNKCGREFDMQPNSFLGGCRCPRCVESHGEIGIRNFLEKHNFKYESQYRIEGCKDKRKLPFDYAVFNENELLMLIEYQGKQHYEPIKHFGGIKKFEAQKQRDNIKKVYCVKHNIPLVEIPYTIEDIETYLDGELSKLNKPIQLALII